MTKEELFESLKDDAKKWVANQQSQINKDLILWVILISLSLAAPFIAYFLKPSAESIGVWFQRSGAITVVLSLLAEIKYNSIERLAIAKDHTFLYCNMYLKEVYAKKVRLINYFTYIVVAIGTIIWGYGDLLIAI